METGVGGGEETRPKACSSETWSAKQNDVVVDSGEKTLEENGVRASENGEHKVVDEPGVIEDCVMNGVSSLLKLKQDVSDKDDAEDAEEEEEEEEEEEHGYHVGDFVWGKIKNHPWWPGQIYDPSEASDLALKIKQKGKFLVAYFGDRTFAWCGPSQLKPFAESFKECSKVSNSRGIVTAVEEAVEEIGRHIERLLIRDCTFELDDNRVVKNAGIKEGVVVPDVRREMISSLLVGKPEGILQDVKGFAETVSFSGLLELEVVKRKVSAFYRSKRGYGLTEFPEPQSVPGLEDKNNDDDDDDDDDKGEYFDDGCAKRSTMEKGKEEEALDPDAQPSSIQKCSGFPDHRLQHRRKQKSLAEILENESCAKVRFEIEPEDEKEKCSRKKLVKRSDEVKGELALVTTTNPRSRRMKEDSKGKGKRKKRDEDGSGSGEREEDGPEEEADNDSTPLASLRKRVKVDDTSSAGNGETSTQTTKRERKKSKYFSPEFLSDFSSKGRKKTKTEPESSKVPSQSQVGELMANASNSLVLVEEDNSCELLLLENGVGRQELSEELSNAIQFLRLGARTVEIRDLIRVSALGTEYPKDSSARDMVREFMSIYRSFTYHEGANSKFLASYNSADSDKDGTGKPEEIEQTGKEENETDEHETAKKQTKPKTLTSKKQADKVEETRKEVTGTTKKERKRKKPESEKKADEEEETLKESAKKERKTKKPKSRKQGDEEEEASGSTKKEKKAKKPKFEEQETRNVSEKKEREGKTKQQESEKEFSGAELFLTFGPGSSLPKKEALIEIYGEFGALDEERSYVLDTDLCARVVFLNVADGEKAFESSLESSPFTSTSKVKFRLKYPNERAEEKKGVTEEAETTTVEMEQLKEKLEEIVSLVDKSRGGMTEQVKGELEEEMVNLLAKVRKMPLS